jgi:thiamine-phosphate pyrophosphorylase
VDFVQVREKDLCDRDLFELTREIVGSARGSRCRVLVNGRADIALAAGAGGVHLPSVGILASDIRPWLPKGFTVGVSTHSARQAARAAAAQADYVLFGPLFPTDSKLGYGPPLGLEPLRRLCRSLPIPVLGLGGIHPQQVSLVLGAGAAGVAGISLFQNDACFRGLESLPAGRAGIYRERRGPDPQQ